MLAENLVLRGYQATVLTQQEPGTPEEEWIHGVNIVRIPVRLLAGVRVPSGYIRRLRSMDADLFHLNGNRIWCADFYFPVARLFRWPQILTGHGFYQYAIHPRARDRWYFERYLPWAIGAFDAYACRTDHERSQLASWGVPREKLWRIPDGVDVGEFATPTESPAALRERWALPTPLVAVYAGGFFENKRVDRLIEAVAKVRDRWALVLLGRDVPESPYNAAHCAELAERLGVSVRIGGAVSRSEVVASYLAADAIASASEYEGFGLAIAEALAAGRPFVAWSTGAIPEMAATGGGVAVDSVAALSAALLRLDDDTERAAMGRRAREASKDWSIDAMIGQTLEMYRQVTSK